MSYDYDSWLQDSSAYEEWAGISEEEDREDEFDRWRDEHNGAYDKMRAIIWGTK